MSYGRYITHPLPQVFIHSMSNDRHEVAFLENTEPRREAHSIIYGITLFSNVLLFHMLTFPALAQAGYSSPFYSMLCWP